MKIDILFVGDNKLNSIGGEQESTKIIISGVKQNYRIGTIQPGNKEEIKEGVMYFGLTKETRIKHLIMRPFSFLKYLTKLRKKINQLSPSVIHTQAQFSLFYISFLKRSNLINKNIILIHTERGLFLKYNDIVKFLFKISLKNVNTMVFTTNYNKSLWQRYLSKQKLRLDTKVIENTAGIIFEDDNNKSMKPENDILTIGFAGRYAEWKNWPLAVEIVTKLHAKLGANLEVKMAVGCLDKEAHYKANKMFLELNEMLGEKFEGHINLPIESMSNFYDGIDIYILTSNKNTESFGRTLVEAMSRKVIALTTNCGGAVEVVGNTNNILEKSSDFVRVILKYYNDQDLRKNEINRALNRVKNVYSMENNITKHLQLYDKKI